MDCKEIIEKHLKDNNFDGLYMPGECGCLIDDLIPCQQDFSICRPGYKHENVIWEGETVNWIVSGNDPKLNCQAEKKRGSDAEQ